MANDPTSTPDILCCPRCQGRLKSLTCACCQTSFSQTLGIPDLRWPRPSQTAPGEEALIEELVDAYPTSSFAELVTLRFQQNAKNAPVPDNMLPVFHDYFANLGERGRQMVDMFRRRVRENFELPARRRALDLGCGVGASSMALSDRFETVVGVDADLLSLIIARKFMEEQEVGNVILIQGYAQHLPLAEGTIDYAVAQNVIEHLFDVASAFDELQRVLRPGGCFGGDSRNRFDLLLPEPHAQLRWVGFWPRRWQSWYVWRLRRIKYEHAHLLSLPELKRFAREAFGPSAQVTFPFSVAYGRSPEWDKLISFIERIPLLRSLCLFFFPSHLLVAQAEAKR